MADAAEKLGRKWIGIDITQLAVTLIKNRLLDTYGSRLKFVSSSARTPADDSSFPLPKGEGLRVRGKSAADDTTVPPHGPLPKGIGIYTS